MGNVIMRDNQQRFIDTDATKFIPIAEVKYDLFKHE
jgi:hypothetical protein